jgi:hypothetical protein
MSTLAAQAFQVAPRAGELAPARRKRVAFLP